MPTSQATSVDLIQLIGHLVKFPTLSEDHATNKAALDWVKYQLRELPLIIHDYDHNGVPSLVLTTRKTKHPKVMLVAHMDVIPAPADMFEVSERDGRLYGRGVFDMKQAVAIYMKILLELGTELAQYDLGVMITADEERGGAGGAGYLVNQQGWRADVVVNYDAIAGWQIEQQAKGITRAKLTSTGQAGHGSRPWAAQNAIVPLMACLQELSSHFPPEPCADSTHAHNTINIGTISGGLAVNQVPAHAVAAVDIRFMPSGNPAAVFEFVKSVAAGYPSIVVEPLELNPGVKPIATDNGHLCSFAELVTKITGVTPDFTLSHGGSDSRYFAEHGIPTITTGPPGGGHHSDSEWVDLRGLEQLASITAEFVRQTAKA